jgi:hypothetical protein
MRVSLLTRASSFWFLFFALQDVATASTTYAIRGTVSGLNPGASIGLTDAAVEYNPLAPEALDITANGPFAFTTQLPSGSTYAVTISAQPAWVTCTIANATGTVATADVTNISITCPTGILGTYTVNGTVSGLAPGATVGVFNDGVYVSSVSTNGPFTFYMPLVSGPAYAVTIGAQPTGETCTTANGTGQVGSLNIVTGVVISCFTGGGNAAVASVAAPGARESAASWTDATGNLWLFGGQGYDSNGTFGYLDDLWKFNPKTDGTWIWFGGSSSANQGGTYGSRGTASISSSPGGRINAVSWVDASSKLWLFGGLGYDSRGGLGELNDLWEYSSSLGAWTWVSGANTIGATGIYNSYVRPVIGGSAGRASRLAAVPGARDSATSWIDSSGILWLYGGKGFSSTNRQGYLGDLWAFAPSTGTWLAVAGPNTINFHGMYQHKLPSTGTPGARESAVAWADASGSLWFFGGRGFELGTTPLGSLNDLWKYAPAVRFGRPSAATWTRLAGGFRNPPSRYGTSGVASTLNGPSKRAAAVSWTDAAGNFWLFGGTGEDSMRAQGELNDLWEYIPTDKTWTWVGGSDVASAKGVYGTQNSPSAANVPGARSGAASWTDASGNFWLYGGKGYDATGTLGDMNDLWEYVPASAAGASGGTWTWVNGSNVVNQPGVYTKTTVPSLTFFVPGAFPGTYGAFGQLATTGTYPNETIWTPDGKFLWEITPSGSAAPHVPVGGTANAMGSIVRGPDGAVWFPVWVTNGSGMQYQIARVDASGKETDFQFSADAIPTGIAVGPDNNLWIATTYGGGGGAPASIAQMTISGATGTLPTFYAVQNAPHPIGLNLGSIISGPNSALWFLETTAPNTAGSYYLGEITTGGQVSSFALPVNFAASFGTALAAGSDGNLWIAGTESVSYSQMPAFGLLQVIPPTQSSISGLLTIFYPIPNGAYVVNSVVAGPDGALWGSLVPAVTSPATPPVMLHMATTGVVSYVPIPAQPGYIFQPANACNLVWDPTGVLWFDVCGVYATTSIGPLYSFAEAFIGKLKP